jgi:hypothetical protein
MGSNDHRPVYIVSSPRSGSTLLRLILDNHPNIAIPPPGYLFNLIYPYLYSYGDLNIEGNFRELAEDILETPTVKRWPIDLNIDEIVAAAGDDRSFAFVYRFLHETNAALSGKPRWGQKSPRNGVWMDEINALFPGAQFIHLVRDGRDVAIDLADANFWPDTLHGGAIRWRDCMRAVAHLAPNYGTDSLLEVRYEDLCSDPEATLRQICLFLGEPFDPEYLHHHKSDSTKGWSTDPTHAAVGKPITTEFVGMHETRLGQRDREAIEALIGPELRDAGYSVTDNPEPMSRRLQSQLIEADMISGLDKFQFKSWYKARRKARKVKGTWSDADRDTVMWGFD